MTAARPPAILRLLAAAWFVAACHGPAPHDEPRIPQPDLAEADPEVRTLAERLVEDVRRSPGEAERWGRLGDLYRTSAYPVEAIEAYERARSLQPGSFRWVYRLGLTWSYLDPARAVPILREAVRLRPEYAPARVHLARALAALGADDDAEHELREALAADAGLLRARVLLASVLLRKGALQEARIFLEAALDEAPEDPEALRLLALVLGRLGDPEVAGVQRRAYAARGPAAPLPDPEARSLAPPAGARAHFERGLAAMEAGRLEEAERSFRRALDNQPGHAPSRLQLGRLLAHQGRNDEALVQFREAARLRPGDPHARLALGKALALAGLDEEAAAAFAEALRLQPESWDAQVGLGTSLVKSGRDAEHGLDLLRDAWRRRQDPPLGAFIGSELARRGRVEEAADVLEASWSDGSGPPEAGVNLALLEAQRGALHRARERLEHMLELSPHRSDVWLGLGHVHRRARRFPEAAAAYRRAWGADPSLPEAGAWLAWTLLQEPEPGRARLDEALAASRSAALRSPADPWCQMVYACTLKAAGREQEAARQVHRAMALARAAGRQDLAGHAERWFGPLRTAAEEDLSRGGR